MHFGDAAGADEEVRRQTEHGHAQKPQTLCFPPDQTPDGFHSRHRIIRRQGNQRPVRNFFQEIHPVPPTVKPSILRVGWPTPTGTLCPSLPQGPMPLASPRSLPIMLTRVSASGPLPMSVAPFTGCVTLPSSMRYASAVENTNLPLVMSTWPPPKLVAYRPFFTLAIISLGSCEPASM